MPQPRAGGADGEDGAFAILRAAHEQGTEPMSDAARKFLEGLDELIAAGHDDGLSDEEMIALLDQATKTLREGLS
jgi:hypothetical protein